MSQREPDDTTKPDAPPTREPGRYYYDDATGYEIYDPARDEKEEDEEDGPSYNAQSPRES